jgi:hypothetical protein
MIDLTSAQGFLDPFWQWCRTLPEYVWQWCQTRDWDPYKFSSPLLALAVQFSSRPFKRKLAAAHDRKLSEYGITDSAQREIALYIAKDWDLQVSYFATMFSVFFSVASITHAFSGGGGRFAFIFAVIFVPLSLIYVFVLKAELGSLSTPLAAGAKGRAGFTGWLSNRKRWKSYADFYSFILRVVNVALLFVVLTSMPNKAHPHQ